MKLLFRFLIAGGLFVGVRDAQSRHFWRGKVLDLAQVEKRWGVGVFTEEGFKRGNRETRASMAASILRSPEKFVGKTLSELRGSLGNPDGFYFRDSMPAYLLEVGNEAWQLVFLYGEDRKIAEVFVHKNCCE